MSFPPPPAPEPITNKLLDRLVAVEFGEHNDLELKRIEAEANKVIRAGGDHVGPAYQVLGAVATYKMDIVSVDRYFKLAYQYLSTPEESVQLSLNRTISYHRTYRFQKSLDNISETYSRNRDDLTVIAQAFKAAKFAARFDLAFEFEKKLLKLQPTKETELPDSFETYIEKANSLSINLSDVTARLDFVGKILLENRIRYHGCEVYINTQGECLYEFVSEISAERAADLNFEIADKLAEEFSDPLDRLIVFSVRPARKENLMVAS